MPNATQAPGEHICPVEWFSQSQLLLETRDGPQNPTGIAIALLDENSAKGALPLGNFSIPFEQKSKGVYTPEVSEPKQALLAKAIAYSFLSYPGLSDKGTSKGKTTLKQGSGVAVYHRAWDKNRMNFQNLIMRTATPWERRIQLLNLAIRGWQVGNPLVLYGPSFFTPELQDLLGARFAGTDELLDLCDESLYDSVILAPTPPKPQPGT